jgi:hypothetical protein
MTRRALHMMLMIMKWMRQTVGGIKSNVYPNERRKLWPESGSYPETCPLDSHEATVIPNARCTEGHTYMAGNNKRE